MSVFKLVALFSLFVFANAAPTSKPQDHRCCGYTPVSQSRVIDGLKNAEPGAWPWQIALKSNGSFICGGSLISDRWVITAAHCVTTCSTQVKYEVVTGKHNLNTTEGKEETIPVKRVISHPNYNKPPLSNDIALIELPHAVQLSDRVSPVCLPKQDYELPAGSKCYITVGIEITDQMVCAGKEGTNLSSCHGDNGGPYVCVMPDGRYTLQGDVTLGAGSCNARFTVFGRVAKFRNWIDKYIGNSENDPATPQPVAAKSGTFCQCDDSAICVNSPEFDGCELQTGNVWGDQMGCGRRNPLFLVSLGRIVGGQEAQKNSWPWQAALYIQGRQFCGGALVTTDHVITAAHCVASFHENNVHSLTVGLGAHDMTESRGRLHKVRRVTRHKEFSPETLYYDIAIITLVQSADLNNAVGVVCLPDIGITRPKDKTCTIAGWGALEYHGSQPGKLNEAEVQLISNERCNEMYGDLAPAGIHNSMICAAAPGKGPCSGDSGGPLVCEYNNTWYMEGITSWGIRCAEPEYPGVYANVRNLLDWVTRNIDKYSLMSS